MKCKARLSLNCSCLGTVKSKKQLKMKLIFCVTFISILCSLNIGSSAVAKELEKASWTENSIDTFLVHLFFFYLRFWLLSFLFISNRSVSLLLIYWLNFMLFFQKNRIWLTLHHDHSRNEFKKIPCYARSLDSSANILKR